jgi:two-component system sensor histidine kinase/response regulator
MSFLEYNLDYAYFLAGFAFVALGVTSAAVALERDRTLPWWALTGFGFANGLALWGITAAIDLGDIVPFAWGRLGVRLLGWLLLFEFGRRGLTHAVRRMPGVWLTFALAAVAGVAAALGGFRAAQLFGAYAIAGLGGLLSAGAAWQAWRSLRTGRTPALPVIGAALAVYALTVGPFGESGGGASAIAPVVLGGIPGVLAGGAAAVVAILAVLWHTAARQLARGDQPDARHAYARLHSVPVMALVLVVGGFAVTQASTQADTALREALLRRAWTAAAAIETDNVLALHGLPSDDQSVEYAAVHEELTRLRIVNRDLAHIYLLTMLDGRPIYLVDCPTGAAAAAASPGDVFAAATPSLTDTLVGTAGALVQGPFEHADGTWMTALVPLLDGDGVQVAVLGVDIAYAAWVDGLAPYRVVAIALVLVASCLVLGFLATTQISLDTARRLSASETRLRSILGTAPDGIAIIDPVTHAITFANDQLVAMLGVDREQLEGAPMSALFADGRPVDCELAVADGGGVSERRLLTVGGELDVEMTCAPIRLEERTVLVTFVHDISARKASERELQERITLENIIRAVSGRFISVDAGEVDSVVDEALAALGSFLDVDRAYLTRITRGGTATRTHEWCAPGVVGQRAQMRDIPVVAFPWFFGRLSANEFVHIPDVDDLPDEAATDRAMLLSQGVRSSILVPLIENGRLSAYLGLDCTRELRSWSGERIALLTVFGGVLDAAVRRSRAEAEVAKLMLAVTNSPAATVITDERGTIEYVNPRFCELSGYTSDELVGANPRVLKSGRNAPGTYVEMWAALTRGDTWHGELSNRRKDAVLYAVQASISPVRDAAGAIHYVGVQEDITPLKIAEVALREAAETAEAANRAKSDFLATMSHEIRTPMNAIIGMAELLEETPLTDEQSRYVRVFRSAGESLLTLINDILDLSKIEAGRLDMDPREFVVEDTVEEMADVLAIRAREKGIELLVDVDPRTPRRMIGDPDRLRQVLINLAGNAVKFTETGHVLVEVALDDSAGKPRVRFSVTDTGIGISPEKVTTIFEAFTQADSSTTRKYGGTGLGLTISRRLVEMMGGRLVVASEVGAGSTFSFDVPVVEPAETVETVVAAVGETLERTRALVVDDSATNRMIVRRYLEHAGAEVDEAEDAEAALSRLRESAGAYDIVLTDLRMPGMSGIELASTVRDDPAISGTSVIVLSSEARPGDDKRAIEAGASALLTKPVRRSALLDAVTAARRSAAPGGARVDADATAVARRRSKPVKPAAIDGASASARSLGVLLVEDTDDNRMLVLAYLKNTPHRVTCAEDGAQAVEAYRRAGAGGFDLVLMDMQMPVMDGYAATREVRRIERDEGWPHTPVVALTAYALAEETSHAIAAGCDDYLTKPIKKATLLDALARYEGD